MNVDEVRYQRLPGRRAGLIRQNASWLAGDHVLLIDGTRIHEAYRRVYLSDIQALIVRRRIRITLNMTRWLPLLLIAGPLSFLVGASFRWLPYTLLAVSLFLILLEVLRGYFSGCDLDLATAVGNVRVPSVTNTSAATKFASKITPVITAAQAPAVETVAVSPE